MAHFENAHFPAIPGIGVNVEPLGMSHIPDTEDGWLKRLVSLFSADLSHILGDLFSNNLSLTVSKCTQFWNSDCRAIPSGLDVRVIGISHHWVCDHKTRFVHNGKALHKLMGFPIGKDDFEFRFKALPICKLNTLFCNLFDIPGVVLIPKTHSPRNF